MGILPVTSLSVGGQDRVVGMQMRVQIDSGVLHYSCRTGPITIDRHLDSAQD